MSLPGVYRARAVKLDGKALTTYVPQIFGDTSISITDIAGGSPTTFPSMGWVLFQAGEPEAPVWMGDVSAGGGTTTGGGGTVTDTLWVSTTAPTDPALELWWDSDEPPASVPTVTGSRAGNAALASLLVALDSLGIIINSTTA